MSFFDVKFFFRFTCIHVIFWKRVLIVFTINIYSDCDDSGKTSQLNTIAFFVNIRGYPYEYELSSLFYAPPAEKNGPGTQYVPGPRSVHGESLDYLGLLLLDGRRRSDAGLGSTAGLGAAFLAAGFFRSGLLGGRFLGDGLLSHGLSSPPAFLATAFLAAGFFAATFLATAFLTVGLLRRDFLDGPSWPRASSPRLS